MGRLPTPNTAVFQETDTDVGIDNTEKYRVPTKKYRKYRKIGKSRFFI